MTRTRISGLLIAALLGYAAFLAGTTNDKVNVAQADLIDCAAMECTAAAAVPPSSNLFM